ncbi:hypothetical protein [Actinokineospora spheciospongiae]|uniref:hypothetical protein n=1 Tax=Actinokineospora spheciospongiae TaxID=909613 RepID=UPI000D83A3F1|nr:hypothetical protein [Actinokineospora spheciospongiae]PWW54195.1 hypothetical protein DFQ13_11471 [Actinokineospora spheciospongiae]
MTEPGVGTPHGEPLRLGVVPLRPLALHDLVEGAYLAVRRNAGALLGFTLGVLLAVELLHWLLSTLVLGSVPSASAVPTDGTASWEQLRPLVIDYLLYLGLGSVFGLLITGVVTVVVTRAVFGHRTGLGPALAETGRALPRLLGVLLVEALLIGLIAFANIALLAVLGPVAVLLMMITLPAVVYLAIAFTFAQSVAVVEEVSPVASLSRSRELVHAVGWWRVLGVTALVVLAGGLLAALAQALFAQISGGSTVADLLAVALVGTVQAGFGGAVLCLLYVDHRARVEGIDGLWHKAG